jgi:hypothetical protein
MGTSQRLGPNEGRVTCRCKAPCRLRLAQRAQATGVRHETYQSWSDVRLAALGYQSLRAL